MTSNALSYDFPTNSAPRINGTVAQQKALDTLFDQFNITDERAKKITDQFIEEMRKGLDHEGATGKDIKRHGNINRCKKKKKKKKKK
jgi:hexokinase